MSSFFVIVCHEVSSVKLAEPGYWRPHLARNPAPFLYMRPARNRLHLSAATNGMQQQKQDMLFVAFSNVSNVR